MMSGALLYQRLKDVIEGPLKEFVDDQIRALKQRLFLDIIFLIVIPALFIIFSGIYGGLIALVFTGGLAVVTVGYLMQKGYIILRTYHSDVNAWKNWYNTLKIQLQTIGPHNEQQLKKLEKELQEWLSEARRRIKPP